MFPSLCISSGSIANLLDFFGTSLFKSDNMSTQVPRPVFVDYFSPFRSVLGTIPLLLMPVAYRLLAMIPPSVLSARTLSSVRQEMLLRLSLPMSLRLIVDRPAIKV